MALPMNLLAYNYSRGRVELSFINEGLRDEIELAISVMERNLLKRKEEADFSQIIDALGYKLGKGIENVLLREFYAFEPIRRNIGIDPVEIRKRIVKLLGKRGFAPNEEERLGVISRVSEELGISPSELEKIAWSDFEKNLVLMRRAEKRPEWEEVASSYNFHLLDTVLKNSYRVKVFGEFSGSDVKEVAKFCRIKGLIFEINSEGDLISIEIFGPNELFGKRSKYGREIGPIIVNVLKNGFSKLLVDFELYGKRKRLTLESLPKLMSFPIPGSIDEKVKFDSKVEEEVRRLFPKRWKILREEDVLVLEDGSIFLPDFTILLGKEKLFLEIVGFWTKSYIKRKREKLIKLWKSGVRNLILMIDEKLRREFSSVPFKKVYFGKKISLVKLQDLIRELEEKNIEKWIGRVKELISSCETDLIKEEEIQELEPILEMMNDTISEMGYVFLKGVGLIKREAILKRLRELSKGEDVPLDEIKEKFEAIPPEKVGEALLKCGVKVKWISLGEALVSPP